MEVFKATPHRCQTAARVPTADEVVDGGGSIDDRGVHSARGLSCALAWLFLVGQCLPSPEIAHPA